MSVLVMPETIETRTPVIQPVILSADATVATRQARRLLDFAQRVFYETFAGTCSDEDMALYMAGAFNLQQQLRELRDPQSIVYLAEIDGELAGYARLHEGETPACVPYQPSLELERLYVDKPFHGHGVAAALMQRCYEHARQRHYPSMFLGVWEHNHRAQAFYRKQGFTRVGEHVFMMGADAQTDWWMAREV
ncbi:MAG: N-acetyltransferase family protein [Blastocatellia bacterium]